MSNSMMTERAARKALEAYEDARRAGERVHFAREAAGVTQNELAVAIDRTATTVYHVETGKRLLTGRELVAVARVLGVSVGWLRGGGAASPAMREEVTA